MSLCVHGKTLMLLTSDEAIHVKHVLGEGEGNVDSEERE